MVTRPYHLVLLLVLLLGQTALAIHQADIGQHATEHGCEVCLVGQGLGSALPSAEFSLQSDVTAVPPVAKVPDVILSDRHSGYFPRAPPAVS